jgi:hypothetical protein
MHLKTVTRDEFGPIMFNVGGVLESIPRSRSSEYKHIELKSLFLDNKTNNTYSVHPNTNMQAVSGNKADEIIRKHIWNNFFGLSSNYIYSEIVHYPTTFAIYLKAKLGIDISLINNKLKELAVNNFTLQIRNVIFTRVLFLFKPYFTEVANSLIEERPIVVHNDPVFEIKKQWKHWLQ